MGKMKELFIDQMNNQVGASDDSYHYEKFKQEKEIVELNESHKQRYSNADVDYVLKVMLQKYPGKITEEVINDFKSEFYHLNSMRYEC